jgi:hypothetical protein
MNSDKWIVMLIILGTLVISGIALFASREMPDLIRFLLNSVLSWHLYKGRSWARWTTGVLSALAGIFGLLAAGESSGAITDPLLIMGLFYVIASLLLLSGIFVSKHFEKPQ